MDHPSAELIALVSAARPSRRAAMRRLGAAGLGLTVASFGRSVLAEDATPGAMETALPPAIAQFVAAMEAADADLLAASYAPDGVLEEVGFAATFTGREAIREDEAVFLAAFTDVAIEVTNAFAAGDWGAVEWTFAGTYAGAIPGLPPGMGQPVSFRGSSILQAGSAGILRHTQYFDAYAILVQLGALPAPAESGAAATPAV